MLTLFVGGSFSNFLVSIEDTDNTIDSVVIIGKNTVLRLNKREAKRLIASYSLNYSSVLTVSVLP